ncbi:20043_t:CDS:2 [Cetraspora pellucida]|uniref:20043_t:CDS:1 n=1 Tax=Cetraspora pellucida TaxID=1433469 RepID=A0A9N9DYT9_9GLOM|nr:20043_t:CDS:2 [Cetraspora pellucida]
MTPLLKKKQNFFSISFFTENIKATVASMIIMFSTISRLFLEENNDSRWAVKPIVVKDQDYVNQTQYTRQVMISFTAVQAKLKMVSDSVKDIKNTISTSNTSSSTEIDKCHTKFLNQYNLLQITEPVLLKKFIQHLHLNNFFNSIKIFINFKKTESYIYLKTIDQILPNHTEIDLSFYNTYSYLLLLISFNWTIPNKNFTNLFTSNLPIYSNNSTTPSPTLSIIIPEYTSILIKIGSININGLS